MKRRKTKERKEKGPTPTEPAARGRPGPGVSERETQGQGKRKEKGTRGETRRGGDLLHEEHAEYDSTTNSREKTADETAGK